MSNNTDSTYLMTFRHLEPQRRDKTSKNYRNKRRCFFLVAFCIFAIIGKFRAYQMRNNTSLNVACINTILPLHFPQPTVTLFAVLQDL